MRRKPCNDNPIVRVAILADMHCGHAVGLTPKDHWWSLPKKASGWKHKACCSQRELWEWYVSDLAEVNAERQITKCFVNADCIDGRGERSGSTELITVNRFEQCDMAVECLLQTRAEEYVLTYGTMYHTGDKEDYEDYVCTELAKAPGVRRTKIGSHEWPKKYGVVFDMKHHLSASSVPYGQFTPLAKDKIWNQLWSIRDKQPNADIIIRSHVHAFVYGGEYDWLAITTPCLQALGTKYGARKCSKYVTLGYLVFDIYPNGTFTWQPRIADLKVSKALSLELL